MNLIIFLAFIFLATFLIGKLLEKIRIPWIFSALLIGLILSAYNPFKTITSSSSFLFLAEMGMFFILFIIGFELDFKKILKTGNFIFKTTFVVIFTETLFGTLLVHYVFNIPWFVSILVASSFATVGEAVILPILDEFKLVKTKLGQTILGIGVLDDLIEVLTIVVASILIGHSIGHSHFDIWINLLILISLFVLVFVLVKLRSYIKSFKYKDVSASFLFVIFLIFLFIGIGQFVEAGALGALLVGIALRNIMPKNLLGVIDSEIRAIAYGFFGPIFFLWVGIDTDIGYIIKFPLLIILVMLMTKTTKVVSSYLMGRKVLGGKKSIILGVSLCVKLSTSIVIIKLLFENGLIQSDLYSVLIGTMIVFKFIVPVLMSYLITKWKIGFSRSKTVNF